MSPLVGVRAESAGGRRAHLILCGECGTLFAPIAVDQEAPLEVAGRLRCPGTSTGWHRPTTANEYRRAVRLVAA